MKATFISLAFLLPLAALSQHESKIATASILQSSYGAKSIITVVYENGESEITPLKPGDKSKIVGYDDSFIENQKIITNFLNQMKKKGYEVSKMNSSETSYRILIFLIFEKKE
jgi:hypothetical protein